MSHDSLEGVDALLMGVMMRIYHEDQYSNEMLVQLYEYFQSRNITSADITMLTRIKQW
jgi:hypothetical protein